MLRQRPDREDQVMRRQVGDASLNGPLPQDRRFLVDERLQIARQRVGDARRALQDLVGEEAAFARIEAAHLELAMDIGEDLGHRVAVRIERPQRIEPGIQKPLQQRGMDRLLRAEIVQHVRLRQTRALRDLVERRATKAVGREHVERGLEDRLAVAGLNPRRALAPEQAFRHPVTSLFDHPRYPSYRRIGPSGQIRKAARSSGGDDLRRFRAGGRRHRQRRR